MLKLATIQTATLPHTLAYGFVYFPIGALYFNSMLATLNVRSYIRATPSVMSSMQPTFPSSQGRRHTDRGPNVVSPERL